MRRQSFRQRYEVHVPSRNPIGFSPSREETFRFVIPDDVQIQQDGSNARATVVDVNYGGLTELRREFRQISDGVELVWKLANGEVFPVSGRDARIEIELQGESTQSMSLSPKYQALRQRFFDRFFFDGLVVEYHRWLWPTGRSIIEIDPRTHQHLAIPTLNRIKSLFVRPFFASDRLSR